MLHVVFAQPAPERPIIAVSSGPRSGIKLLLSAGPVGVAVLAALFALSYGATLDHYPVVGNDEVIYNSPAYNLAFKGRLATELMGGLARLNEYYYVNPPFHPFLVAVSFRLLGYSIFTARLPCLVFGTATLLLTYALVYRLSKSETWAFLAALGLAGSTLWEIASRSGRMDTIVSFWALLGIFLLYQPRPDAPPDIATSRRRLFIVGMCWGISVISGIRGAFLVAGFWAVLLAPILMTRRSRVLSRIAVLALGMVLGMSPWLGFIAAEPALFLKQFWTHASYASVFPAIFYQLGQEVFISNRLPGIYLPALALLVSFLAYRRADPSSKALFVNAWVAAVLLLTACNLPLYFFGLFGMPLFLVVGAVSAALIVPELPKTLRVLTLAFVIGTAVLSPAKHWSKYFWGDERSDYEPVARWVREAFPGEAVLCGPVWLWYAANFNRDQFLSLESTLNGFGTMRRTPTGAKPIEGDPALGPEAQYRELRNCQFLALPAQATPEQFLGTEAPIFRRLAFRFDETNGSRAEYPPLAAWSR
jgi:4-amino-4-deoxy-L-arabinose transferase-like glycosyltransferase